MNAVHTPEADAIVNVPCSTRDPLPGEDEEWTLKRTGRKPVRFTGRQIIEARGVPQSDSLWYDLNIYRSLAGAVIVELIARRTHLHETDLMRVEVFPDLAAASAWLEAHRCAPDVPVPEKLAGTETPLVTLALQAVALRQRIARIEDEFQALLCDVFTALGIAETPEDILAGITA